MSKRSFGRDPDPMSYAEGRGGPKKFIPPQYNVYRNPPMAWIDPNNPYNGKTSPFPDGIGIDEFAQKTGRDANSIRRNIAESYRKQQEFANKDKQIRDNYSKLSGIPSELQNDYNSFLYHNNGDPIQATIAFLNSGIINAKYYDRFVEDRINAVKRYLDSLYASSVSSRGWNK